MTRVNSRGFTMVELLMSIVILLIIMLAVYSFFEEGQWIYLSSEKKTNLQENVRLTLEGMERDLRMIGYGVPAAGHVTSGLGWHPYIKSATADSIVFHTDIDTINTIAKQDLPAGATQIFVDSVPTNMACPGALLVLSIDNLRWQEFGCTSVGADSITLASNASVLFPVNETVLHTLERIYYRFVAAPDLDGDGQQDYPFGRIQRAEVSVNSPSAPDPVTIPYADVAYNIQSLQFSFYQPDGDLVTNNPLLIGDLQASNKIGVTIVGRDRGRARNIYQDVVARSEILIRNRRL